MSRFLFGRYVEGDLREIRDHVAKESLESARRLMVRVVYFFLAEPGRIYMAAIYAKSRKETLSAADQNVLARLAAQIKKAAKGGR